MRTPDHVRVFRPAARRSAHVTLLTLLVLAGAGSVPASAKEPYVGFSGPPRPDDEVSILRLTKVDWLDIDGTRVYASEHGEVRLLPGTYWLEWGRQMAERVAIETYRFADSVTLEAGHVYSVHVDREHPFGMGYVPFLWIEDMRTRVVVSGTRKEPKISRGTHEHEAMGYFFRLTGGFGTARTSNESRPGAPALWGEDLNISLAAGATFWRNIAIHVTWLEWSIEDPNVDLGGTSQSGAGEITLNFIGVGLTYYFTPLNVYVSGSVGGGDWDGTVEVQGTQMIMEVDHGFVLDLSAGKEWWIADGWGLGAAGGFGYHTLPDNLDGHWSGTRWTLMFSLTFN